MDLITQGLAGAVVAAAAARRDRVRVAAAVGFVAGLIPDADVLIRSSADPLLTLEFHRQFTHSLLFIPLGALLGAALAWLLVRRRIGFAATYGFALLGILPSGLLDASTSYGTQLLWPFSDARIAWNLIAIIDPVFTGALLIGAIVALVRYTPTAARAAALFALAYLGFGLVQHERVEGFATALARERGHAVERLEVKPTLGNLVLWRTIYQSGDHFHVDAIRVGVAGRPHVYAGGSVPHLEPDGMANVQPDSVLAEDIRRFARFSEGYVARHPSREDVIGDVRYSLRPNGVEPLWGIEIDPSAPQRHAAFRTFRDLDGEIREAFFAMLLGKPLDGSPAPRASVERP